MSSEITKAYHAGYDDAIKHLVARLRVELPKELKDALRSGSLVTNDVAWILSDQAMPVVLKAVTSTPMRWLPA